MLQENQYEMDPDLNKDLLKSEPFQENNDQDEKIDDDVEDFESEQQEYDSSDDYGSSGEKYGWYNGFSDDAIDDAFEGDPENTWNVD